MKLVDRYIKLKEIYPDCVVLIKSGSFYHTYYDDAILFQCLFRYRLCDNKVGFPTNSLNKVKSRLYRLNLSVILIENNSIIKLIGRDNLYYSIVSKLNSSI